MTLGLTRYGNALQACRQLGTLVEAQLLMPCVFGALLFGALNELSLQDRQRSNEKTPASRRFWCNVRWKQWQVEAALRHGGWLGE
ncbi:hypothetical protein [Xanthomonas hortorum]|uniref:Uncharacterized protein n=2 Tax=Xanthomonas TaxID=338 RepID=A0A6V7C5X9_9XANT|nr:hypothetical protein [Xanthomonas hortorum]MBG3851081.1 hypothetical protein [Xanthomonas hortorum pv. carotae]ETC86060.1 hypothetical protein XHC_3793 [Xanthomonas hortorum pv. carotae str. M081]UTS73742.1 hypothetical protein NMB96_02465 [Xanthomonas hortorum]CAD0309661.1 hypothetical protein CFBP7900_07100 [Xanthomonas hortorum pv. carotae]CAD0309667.1 hypothetical protein CFBP7900_07100 [Xanthomonas hortorum pv. carotae]